MTSSRVSVFSGKPVSQTKGKSSSLLANAASQALPAADKAYFESRLDADFSQVRVYNDAQAQASATALGANAFAVGHDIAFAAGRYQPGTTAGRELLAHELVHVAQQERGASGFSGQAEVRATAAATRVALGQAVTPLAQGGAEPGIHCDPDEKKKEVAAVPPPIPAPAPQAASGNTDVPVLPPPVLQGTNLMGMPPLLPWSALMRSIQVPQTLQPLPPTLPPYHLMINADILAPFSAYGTSPATAGMDMHGDWAKAYFMFRNYLPESLAATSANMFLSSAYQASFTFNQPNIFDKSNLNFKSAYPDDKRTPIIPFISSGSMTSIYEKITGKKNTNAFYF